MYVANLNSCGALERGRERVIFATGNIAQPSHLCFENFKTVFVKRLGLD